MDCCGCYTPIILTVHKSTVGAAVEEDTDGLGSAIVDLVIVDLGVATAPRGDDTCQ